MTAINGGLDPINRAQLEASLLKTNGAAVQSSHPGFTGAGDGTDPASATGGTSHQSNVTKAKLYARMVGVLKAVKYIQKDKKNAFHGYTYASESAIKGELHTAFAAEGLVMLPPEILEVIDGERDPKGQFLTTIKVKFGIADAETGEAVYGTGYGRGQDNMDKGIYKALTGAMKYFLTTTFLIPTGDDPERDEEPPPPVYERPYTPPPPPPIPPRATSRPAPAPENRPAPWVNRGSMKVCFGRVRERVGETLYLETLAKYGVGVELIWRNTADRSALDTALACYHELIEMAVS